MSHDFRLPSRADHVGSLLRPRALRDAFKKRTSGDLAEAEFVAIQDHAVRDVVDLQEKAGLKAITDGEFRRASYWARFVEKVQGLDVRDAVFKFRDDSGKEATFGAPHVVDKIKRNQPIAEDEYLFLKKATHETPKITLPSPPSMHFWRIGQSADPGLYDTDEQLFDDLAAVYRQEIAHLYELGLRYVQCDDVPLAMLCDPAIRDRVVKIGYDPDKLLDDYVGLFANCFAQVPDDMITAVHLCRGNYKGRFLSAGGYEDIAEKLFTEIPANVFFLEYDTPRAGDFAPLRFVPEDKTVVLGIVSSKDPRIEAEDDLRRRIDEAAQHIDLDRLAISPQCGFASSVGGNPVTIDIEREKLELVTRVADKIWH